MKLAVASGKGGTGKTTVATSLAVTLARWAAGWGATAAGRIAHAPQFPKPGERPA